GRAHRERSGATLPAGATRTTPSPGSRPQLSKLYGGGSYRARGAKLLSGKSVCRDARCGGGYAPGGVRSRSVAEQRNRQRAGRQLDRDAMRVEELEQVGKECLEGRRGASPGSHAAPDNGRVGPAWGPGGSRRWGRGGRWGPGW